MSWSTGDQNSLIFFQFSSHNGNQVYLESLRKFNKQKTKNEFSFGLYQPNSS